MSSKKDAVVPLHLNPLNPYKRFKGNEVCVFTGRKEGGKTTTIFDLLRIFATRWYDGLVFNGSEDSYLDKVKLRYRSIMPGIAVHSTHDPDKLIAYMDYAAKWNTEHQQKPWRFIVCDDFSFDQDKFKGKIWKKVIQTARHIPIMVFLVLHDLKYLAGVRDTLEYIFLYHTNRIPTIEFWWKEFGAMVDKDTFKSTLHHYFKAPRTSIVIDTKCSDDDPRKAIFWYQPPVACFFNFTVCYNKDLWQKNDKYGKYPNPIWIEPPLVPETLPMTNPQQQDSGGGASSSSAFPVAASIVPPRLPAPPQVRPPSLELVKRTDFKFTAPRRVGWEF